MNRIHFLRQTSTPHPIFFDQDFREQAYKKGGLHFYRLPEILLTNELIN
jgi:hypothetical protein